MVGKESKESGEDEPQVAEFHLAMRTGLQFHSVTSIPKLAARVRAMIPLAECFDAYHFEVDGVQYIVGFLQENDSVYLDGMDLMIEEAIYTATKKGLIFFNVADTKPYKAVGNKLKALDEWTLKK